jgi:uncharacterized membrane protein (DUF2068 family)
MEFLAGTGCHNPRHNQAMTARRSGVLRWIIAFKATKAIALTILGVALLTTRRADPVDLVIRLALAVHLPLTSRLLGRAIAVLSTLTISKQTTLALTAFAYATLMGSEGVALYLRKPWARWFTIIATSSLIPIEVYEIGRKPDLTRIVVLVTNAAVVVCLWRRREVFDGG